MMLLMKVIGRGGEMNRLRSTKGISYVVVIFAVIALALVLLIIIPIMQNSAEENLKTLDEQYVATAEKEAKVLFIQNGTAFSAVFDTETKKFFSEKEARFNVNPYGMSRQHRGKYILVTIDESGNISSKWIKP